MTLPDHEADVSRLSPFLNTFGRCFVYPSRDHHCDREGVLGSLGVTPSSTQDESNYEDLHDVILVGHSFGGVVISGVAERAPERLAQVVYLDASVPADGQGDDNFDYPAAEAYNEAVASEIADNHLAVLNVPDQVAAALHSLV